MYTEYNFGDFENSSSNIGVETLSTILGAYSLLMVVVSIIFIIELWIVFKKCGKKGWYTLIPFLNIWTLFSISGLPGWLSLIPVANFIGLIVAYFKLPKRFGKNTGFGIGMLFLPIIFMGILAFGKSKIDGDTEITNNDNKKINDSNEIGVPNISEDNISNGSNEQIPDLMAPPKEEELVNNQVPENNVVDERTIDFYDINEDEKPNSSINEPTIVNEEATPKIQEVSDDVQNAFAGVAPAFEPIKEENNNELETLDVTMVSPEPLLNNNIESNNGLESLETIPNSSPNINNVPNKNEMEPFSSNESIESLETTFEIPKIPNEMINEDITTTKKCSACGTENPYVNKTCITCGANLE